MACLVLCRIPFDPGLWSFPAAPSSLWISCFGSFLAFRHLTGGIFEKKEPRKDQEIHKTSITMLPKWSLLKAEVVVLSFVVPIIFHSEIHNLILSLFRRITFH